MKVVIFAGGFGTRISEESQVRPKPLVEIGTYPILWHIMKIYSAYGLNEFVICCGYKGEMLKEYFANYYLNKSDLTFDMKNNEMKIHNSKAENWKVTLVDTGLNTMTGGRLKRVREYIGDETFCLTYGDGVSNVNISELIRYHRENRTLATLTAVQPPGRFGTIVLREGQNVIELFKEKEKGDGAWINGGFFVLEPAVIDYIKGDDISWEKEPLSAIASERQLTAYRHEGFWQPMDTLRDKMYLEELWESSNPPWKVWK
ncbi:glucose-1-phosphate cytidylyltransferase [Desulfogranum mediterraneum]|uniref:glucose-1-phosphate cytidylyltransferase n=1 Tax=Desulfogranum mediterraneum TaxID=160661 RepID=UPI00040A0952|nr:glucose-1-phosphate cytidylyltransferase [Desulfogranum mediterraneum]